ncbi:hypothetical protein HGRIS_005933 [Hohenbuehelia grisea]|uniref:GH16 domain-containing protein n=1 Tax=Hohenbuehelia grisea TaxID=104357 RepID=A0ABR3K0T6_9AGAR
MPAPSRRVPPPQAHPQQTYAAVPTSPRSATNTPRTQYIQHSRPPARTSSANSRSNNIQAGRGAIAHGVASGQIGGGYGPYSYTPSTNRDNGVYTASRFSAAPSETSLAAQPEKPVMTATTTVTTVPQYLWDKDPDVDDVLHNPDPIRDAREARSFTIFSWRGWANVSAIVILVAGLMTLFAGYPIIAFYNRTQLTRAGFNLGGINGTGQIPELPNLPTLIDADTPASAMTRTGDDGKKYNLVFSDEFNVDGRTFYPGDDPYWEAVDLHYWPTGNLEWYDPSAATTANGKLVITMEQRPFKDLNFVSGMVSSWNKLCFTTGYIEVSISMPGTPKAPGLWPGAWTLGNLGRAGYGATTEGLWPYSYDSCDVGTFPNQTARDGTPEAAATGSDGGGPLSFLPGQRLSACTCPGSDHPGPSTNKGRGAPEIDIIETEVDVSNFRGRVSQSYQTAPYNYKYHAIESEPQTTIFTPDITEYNSYKGGPFQQAVSALTYIEDQFYNDTAYATYGYEWWSNPSRRSEGFITWYSNGQKTWQMTAGTVAADDTVKVSDRLVPEEPLYVIFNLGMAPGFQRQDFKHLTFPSKMYIDYVRIYQRQGVKNGVTCNPSSHPTSDYIDRHIAAYTNPNFTTWAQAGNTFPRNSRYDGC